MQTKMGPAAAKSPSPIMLVGGPKQLRAAERVVKAYELRSLDHTALNLHEFRGHRVLVWCRNPLPTCVQLMGVAAEIKYVEMDFPLEQHTWPELMAIAKEHLKVFDSKATFKFEQVFPEIISMNDKREAGAKLRSIGFEKKLMRRKGHLSMWWYFKG